MQAKQTITVLGSGSWATALVKILSDNSNQKNIVWWLRNQHTVDAIKLNKHNPNYLSSVEIQPNIVEVTSDLQQAINKADTVLLVIPSAFIYTTLGHLNKDSFNNKKVISAIKGLVPETGQILGEYMQNFWDCSLDNIGVITGPCHAEEVALERLSYLTVASENLDLANSIASLIKNRYIKCTISDDIYGTEYAAVLKNIYSITAGICHGIGYGDNFQAVLMSNAIREMKRFINEAHPIERDINDSAYLGDLLVTGYSQFSRNRTFGNMLGKGYSVSSAQLEMNMIAEGYYATESIYKLNKMYNVDMPILEFTWQVIYNNKKPREIVQVMLDLLN
jgi:glycerol-3-phosphate dehydrogenase (NAD(P)+)